MKKLGIAMAMVLGFGCGGDKVDGALKDMESHKSKVCACKDKGCVDKAYADYKAWEDKMEKSMTEEDAKKITKEQVEKLEKLEDEMKACRKKYDEPAGGGGEAPKTE